MDTTNTTQLTVLKNGEQKDVAGVTEVRATEDGISVGFADGSSAEYDCLCVTPPLPRRAI